MKTKRGVEGRNSKDKSGKPGCAACGVPWEYHPGISVTCERLRLAADTLAAIELATSVDEARRSARNTREMLALGKTKRKALR